MLIGKGFFDQRSFGLGRLRIKKYTIKTLFYPESPPDRSDGLSISGIPISNKTPKTDIDDVSSKHESDNYWLPSCIEKISMKYWILALLWIIYCILHSGLITNSVTMFFKIRLGENYRYYRIFYNAFAIVTLIPVVLYTYSLRQIPFFCWDGYLLPVRYFLLATGLIFLYAGSKHYDMQTFLGLRQIKLGITHNLINTSGKIDSTGILGIIRHPFYSGSILILWSNNLDFSMLIVNVTLSVYLIVGTLLEEKKLVEEFGNEYREYQQKVSMLFPYKWIINKLTL